MAMTKKYYLSALAAIVFASSSFGCNGDGEDYLGSICATAFDFCPSNTLLADGKVLNIKEYAALNSLLGTIYGGDGKTTFALPDLRGRAPVSIDNKTITLGTKRGTETVSLTSAQMPSHTHDATYKPGDGVNPISVSVTVSSNTTGNTNQPSATNNYLSASSGGSTGANMWSSSPGSAPVNLAGISVSGDFNNASVTVGNTGVSEPISIIPPQLGLNYCIVVRGIYPPRD